MVGVRGRIARGILVLQRNGVPSEGKESGGKWCANDSERARYKTVTFDASVIAFLRLLPHKFQNSPKKNGQRIASAGRE